MAHNFLPCDRDTMMLLPPDMRDWLPEGHLAWFVIDAVGELDLGEFVAAYRVDGRGRAAHDPQMMVALTLYAYAIGVRSSRAIERRVEVDVAFRVIAAGGRPDHATIARFRARHEKALGALFTQILKLCSAAGMAGLGTIAIDSTKLAADASILKTRSLESITREILADAAATDAAEDELHGDARGDELPEALRTRRDRMQVLGQAKRRLEAERAEREAAERAKAQAREARQRACAAEGKKMLGRPPVDPARHKHKPPALRTNLTDPDSRILKAPRGFVQGYCAQAAVNDSHVILAAEISERGGDADQLEAMVQAVRRELAVGRDETPGRAEADAPAALPARVLADAGYFNTSAVEALEGRGHEVLVAVRSESARKRRAQDQGKLGPPKKPKPGSVMARMAETLEGEEGKAKYKRRGALVEPVFGQIKFNRRCDRLSRRGVEAARSEWRLFATTHNLLRLWTHSRAAQAA